jgi:hypothetical protein
MNHQFLMFNGVLIMNTDFIADETIATTNKNRTLQTLLQVICAEEEFAVLQETLRIYCEEICLD